MGQKMKKRKRRIKPKELARYSVAFALRRMSAELQSDVLSDGTVAKQAGIEVSNPIELPEGIILDRASLFSAFQRAADGEAISEIEDSSGVEHKMAIEVKDHAGFIRFGAHRIVFPHAALLSANIERRRSAAVAILKSHTLVASARARFEAIARKSDFGEADFITARRILAGAPESFAATLQEVAKKGTLSQTDFLPSDDAHWENITAKRQTSESLADFIAHELADERCARLGQDLNTFVDFVSLTFSGPELVPLETMRQVQSDPLLAALQRMPGYCDPFALAGAFDICVDRALSDARFKELGDTILKRLLNHPKRLRGELATFATTFVIAGAYLAKHEVLRKQPVFWRRLAAASHASLVSRILGGGRDDDRSLLTWAMGLSGKTFYLSVLNDAHDAPRWRPDWISPDFLAADLYGRLLGSCQRLGDAAPTSWRKKLEDSESSMVSEVPPMAHMFPAIAQGWKAPPIDMPPADTPIGEMFTELAQEPTVEKFLKFIQLTYTFGFPVEARESALLVVQLLRTELATTPVDCAQAALDLAAFIAARNHDRELADAVAVVALERLAATPNVDRLLPTATVILECAAADADRKEAFVVLARRLENLAFVAAPDALPEVLDILRILQSINENLAPLLGRGVATARLGLPTVARI
jgi:hypothetical protein